MKLIGDFAVLELDDADFDNLVEEWFAAGGLDIDDYKGDFVEVRGFQEVRIKHRWHGLRLY